MEGVAHNWPKNVQAPSGYGTMAAGWPFAALGSWFPTPEPCHALHRWSAETMLSRSVVVRGGLDPVPTRAVDRGMRRGARSCLVGVMAATACGHAVCDRGGGLSTRKKGGDSSPRGRVGFSSSSRPAPAPPSGRRRWRPWPTPRAGHSCMLAMRLPWGLLRWRILAERSSDKTIASAQSSPRFGMETVAWPYSAWVAECLPKAFHPSQQAPTEPVVSPVAWAGRSFQRKRTCQTRSRSGWFSITSDGVTSACRMMRALPPSTT